jgi:hypothetical protein
MFPAVARPVVKRESRQFRWSSRGRQQP